MKKLATSILVAVLLFVGALQAQTQSKPDSAAIAAQAAHDQQIAAGINALVQYVGKYTTAADSLKDSTNNVTTVPHATWAGILDKSLGMLSGAISKIAETLEQAAPYVWAIMVKQQYAKAFSGIAVPFGLFIFLLFYHHFVNKKWPSKIDEEVDEVSAGGGWVLRIIFGRFIPLVGGIFIGIFLISSIKEAVLLTMNPYYFAIRDMVVLLLGSSHGM